MPRPAGSRRVQTAPANGTVQRGKRQGRVSATIHDKKVGADRGGLRSRSGYHANDHLGHSAEGRREVDKTVRTEPQHTFEWQHGARRRCESTLMLDVESEEGLIKAAVKLVVHYFMETGKLSENQPCEEETDEPNDRSDEEEELCPPLEETMAASWFAQIGEEDLSETEAVVSFIAMNEQRKRTWAQAQVLKKAARKDRGFFSSRTALRNRANGSRQLRQSTRRSSNSMDGDGTPKDLRARLRREHRCFRCKKKGPWKAECPEKQHNKDGTAPAVFSGMTFLYTVNEESVWSAATWSGWCDEDAAWATVTQGIPRGHLIVDSAAGKALIGEAACVK